MKTGKKIILAVIAVFILTGVVALVIFQSRSSTDDISIEKKKEAVGKTYVKEVKIEDESSDALQQQPISPYQLVSPTSESMPDDLDQPTLADSEKGMDESRIELIDKEIIPTIDISNTEKPTSEPKTNDSTTKDNARSLPEAGVISVLPFVTISIAFVLIVASFIL